MQSVPKKKHFCVVQMHLCLVHTDFQSFPGPVPHLPSAGVGNSLSDIWPPISAT